MSWRTLVGKPPLIIAHRGASGELPEHTLEAYARAIELGADFIEPDLVATRDGHLIARHEPLLDETTDVVRRSEFSHLRSTKLLDGIRVSGFFASDFTLEEIKQLRAVQPRANRPQQFNGLYTIPTFEEIIELAQSRGGSRVGIYPETKNPTFHSALGLPLEDALLEVLDRYGWNAADSPVFIQSFETGNLKYLRTRTSIRLVQLIDATAVLPDGSLSYEPPADRPFNHVITGDPRTFGDMVRPENLIEIAGYADAIGPWKPYLVANGGSLITDAHAAGLAVHAFTFRDDVVDARFGGDPAAEYEEAFSMGVDGLFTDFSGTAVRVRERRRSGMIT
jgi:glycerophosphoryl diester phosphodiesterase